MSITLTVSCSMCYPAKKPDLELEIDGETDLNPKSIARRIEKQGWIVQFNGTHMDTYCTKKCAE